MAVANKLELAQGREESFGSFVRKTQSKDPGSVFLLNDDRVVDAEVISTGVISLDVALGVGGLARGRIVELYGPEQSGKSALALSVCVQAQKQGGFVGYIDAEHAFNRQWAVDAFGLDPSRCALSQPDSGVEALRMVQRMCESGGFDVIVVDSVAALVPPAVVENEIGEANQLGQHAKMMSDGLRKLTPVIDKSDAVVIFINQIRMNPGAYGNPEQTTGGKALAFYSSVRMEVRSSAGKRILEGGEAVGQLCLATVKKNKLAPPHKTADYELRYATGLAGEMALISVAEKVGVLTRAGGSYTETETGERLAVGKEKLKARIETEADLRDRLTQAVYAVIDARRKKIVTDVTADNGAEEEGRDDADNDHDDMTGDDE